MMIQYLDAESADHSLSLQIKRERGGVKMTEVRNSDGRLVCQLDEKTGDVLIEVKGRKTLIRYNPDGKPEVVNYDSSTKR